VPQGRTSRSWTGLLAGWTSVALVLGAAGPVQAASGADDPTRYVYPTAPRGPVVDDYFGTAVADPYRWLEDPQDRRTQAWIDQESTLTRRYLDSLPSLPARTSQVDSLLDMAKWSPPVVRQGRSFWTQQDAGASRARLMWAKGKGSPRVLVDPATVSQGADASAGPLTLAEWAPSPDGKLVAWTSSQGGLDWRTIRVVRVDDGAPLPDVIPHARFTELWWSPDGSGFAYHAYPAPESTQAAAANAQLRYHRIGTPVAEDLVLAANPANPREYYGLCCATSTAKVLWALGPQTGTFSWLDGLPGSAPATALFTVPMSVLPTVIHVSDRSLWMIEREGAARGRIVRIDRDAPERQHWTTVVPEQADTLVGAIVVGDRILASYLRDAASQLRLFGMDGVPGPAVRLPDLGTVRELTSSPGQATASFTFTSFTRPTEVLTVDVNSGAVSTWRSPTLTFDQRDFITTSTRIPSKDGTLVHVFIVRRRDVTRDGSNPTLLWGYGGFNISLTPEYQPEWLAWIQSGGIFVYANLRGGGEYGVDWYQAGIRERKQNVFDDFISVAEWLKARRWTRTRRLAITGRSNGGLLVGAVMTQRPGLASVAIPQVGVLDMLRFQNFTVGASWARDYGRSDESAEMFGTLLAYSPLHRLRPGVSYPATLITTAESDDRVVPAHSYKFAAALQTDNASTRPALIRIERGAGHGSGASREQVIGQVADRLAFLDANLGIAPPVPPATFSAAPSKG